MNHDWLIDLTSEQDLLTEGEKSIATHANPNRLIELLGGSKKEPPRSTRLGFDSKLKKIKESYRKKLTDIVSEVARRKRTVHEARIIAANTFRTYFGAAYALGLKKQGVKERAKVSEIISKFTNDDRNHINTMVSEELVYFSKFLEQAQDLEFGMGVEKRIGMYADGLNSIYSGARIAALGNTVLLFWSGPKDDRKCLSCLYLSQAGPYTAENLPTLPKAGDTLCLSNCRDRIVAVSCSKEMHAKAVAKGASKETHLKLLQRIKTERKRLNASMVSAMARRNSPRISAKVAGRDVSDPIFYTVPKVKGKPQGIDRLRMKYAKNRSESKETTMDSATRLAILNESTISPLPLARRYVADRIIGGVVLEEGVYQKLKNVAAAVTFVRKLGNAWRKTKDIFNYFTKFASHYDVSSMFAIVAIQKVDGPEFLVYGTYWKMKAWIKEMDNKHRTKFGPKFDLRWRIVKLTTNVHDAAATALPHTGPAQHISDPREVAFITKNIMASDKDAFRDRKHGHEKQYSAKEKATEDAIAAIEKSLKTMRDNAKGKSYKERVKALKKVLEYQEKLAELKGMKNTLRKVKAARAKLDRLIRKHGEVKVAAMFAQRSRKKNAGNNGHSVFYNDNMGHYPTGDEGETYSPIGTREPSVEEVDDLLDDETEFAADVEEEEEE